MNNAVMEKNNGLTSLSQLFYPSLLGIGSIHPNVLSLFLSLSPSLCLSVGVSSYFSLFSSSSKENVLADNFSATTFKPRSLQQFFPTSLHFLFLTFYSLLFFPSQSFCSLSLSVSIILSSYSFHYLSFFLFSLASTLSL